MVFLAAGFLGARFLGAAFAFGVAFEIDVLGEVVQGFREERWREALIMFPRGGGDCDVHARLSQDHIADEMFVRQFVVDLGQTPVPRCATPLEFSRSALCNV